MRGTQPVVHQQRAYSGPRYSIFGRKKTQDIGVVDIDPDKLMTTLRRRYGENGFQVHVRLLRLSIVCYALTPMTADDAQQLLHSCFWSAFTGKLLIFHSESGGDVASDVRNAG